MNCRACGKFTPSTKCLPYKPRLYCNAKCYGKAQRGKSRNDRSTPSKTEYIRIRHENGQREYLHRFNYRIANDIPDIPDGMVVHHKTENKRINDAKYLALVSRKQHTPNTHHKWRVGGKNEFVDLGW